MHLNLWILESTSKQSDFDGLAKQRITTNSSLESTKTALEVQTNSPSRVKLSTKSNNENFNQRIADLGRSPMTTRNP
jgi:hypothetical protein